MKKDLTGEKLMDTQLLDVQGGLNLGGTTLDVRCLQCVWRFRGSVGEATAAVEEHTRATGHTSFDKVLGHA